MTVQAEIAVVGGGPAGMSAALAAAQAGAEVWLIDGNRQLGGQYFRQPEPGLDVSRGSPRQTSGREITDRISTAGLHILRDTVVWAAFEDKLLNLMSAEAASSLQAQAIIVAVGAYDRPVAFPGWTLPGVMTAGAAQTLLKAQGIVAGRRVLLAGSGPLQLVLGSQLARSGAQVVAILEGGSQLKGGLAHAGAIWGQWERLGEAVESAAILARYRIPYRSGWGIVKAEGRDRVERAVIARLDADWRPVAGTEKVIACDTVCIGNGFIPNVALTGLLGARMEWRPELGGLVPHRDERTQTTVPGVFAAGDGAGIGGAPLSMVEGEIAGIAAALQRGHGTASADRKFKNLEPRLKKERAFQKLYGDLFTPGPGLYELADDETILCRCEEVTAGSVRRALRLGAAGSNEIKSITRTGMGECQGRMCSQIVSHFVARETGQPPEKVGYFRPRPPLFPVPIAQLAEIQTPADSALREEVSR